MSIACSSKLLPWFPFGNSYPKRTCSKWSSRKQSKSENLKEFPYLLPNSQTKSFHGATLQIYILEFNYMFSLGRKEEGEHHRKRELKNESSIVKKTKDIVNTRNIENNIITMISDEIQFFNVILMNFTGSFFIYLCSF